jgi:hypothetical protein
MRSSAGRVDGRGGGVGVEGGRRVVEGGQGGGGRGCVCGRAVAAGLGCGCLVPVSQSARSVITFVFTSGVVRLYQFGGQFTISLRSRWFLL